MEKKVLLENSLAKCLVERKNVSEVLVKTDIRSFVANKMTQKNMFHLHNKR
jgi:hypothetical protein